MRSAIGFTVLEPGLMRRATRMHCPQAGNDSSARRLHAIGDRFQCPRGETHATAARIDPIAHRMHAYLDHLQQPRRRTLAICRISPDVAGRTTARFRTSRGLGRFALVLR
jgi:hypothetical protein